MPIDYLKQAHPPVQAIDTATTETVRAISLATNEQSRGIQEVGQAVTELDNATQQNAALVEQSSAAAMSLKEQAQQLIGVMGAFRTD